MLTFYFFPIKSIMWEYSIMKFYLNNETQPNSRILNTCRILAV